jgi:hypothetical protein
MACNQIISIANVSARCARTAQSQRVLLDDLAFGVGRNLFPRDALDRAGGVVKTMPIQVNAHAAVTGRDVCHRDREVFDASEIIHALHGRISVGPSRMYSTGVRRRALPAGERGRGW